MELSIDLPEPGQIARVRQRLYLVERTTPGPAAADSTLVGLSCVDDDAQGQPLEVLWEREIDTEILTGEAWESIAKRGFDQAKLFASYLNTLRWNCVTSTDPRLFQSPFRAGIKLDAYQLEPLRPVKELSNGLSIGQSPVPVANCDRERTGFCKRTPKLAAATKLENFRIKAEQHRLLLQ